MSMAAAASVVPADAFSGAEPGRPEAGKLGAAGGEVGLGRVSAGVPWELGELGCWGDTGRAGAGIEGAATAAGTPDVGAAVAVEDGDGGMGTVVPASAPVDGGNAGAGVEAEGRAEAGEGLPSVGRPDPARSSKAVARRVNTLSGWRMTKRRRFKENASGWFNPTGS